MVDHETFDLVEEPVRDLADGEYLVQVAYLSIDPTNRIWIREEPSYRSRVGIGEVMRGGGAGVVVESRNGACPVGTLVLGLLGWQEYAICGRDVTANAVPPGVPLQHMMSVFGATGVTAYFGMLEVGEPPEGDTVVVSVAAGATGSIAGQIPNIRGCRVIGLT